MTILRFPRLFLLFFALGTWFFLGAVRGIDASPLETFAETLHRHGIALTEPSLVEALRNPDKQIRSMSAAELTRLQATARIPEIMQAAEIEKDPVTKRNIAAAAAWLGSPLGLNMLRDMCWDSTLKSSVRLSAADTAFEKGDHACFRPIADMMLSSEETDTRAGAISLLSQLHDTTDEELTAVTRMFLAALTDWDGHVRLQVSQGLRVLHSRDAIPALRSALATERDEVVRASMQGTLDSLSKP